MQKDRCSMHSNTVTISVSVFASAILAVALWTLVEHCEPVDRCVSVSECSDLEFVPIKALGNDWFLVQINQDCTIPHPLIPNKIVTIEVPHIVRLHKTEIE
jgi:hypothetical protein